MTEARLTIAAELDRFLRATRFRQVYFAEDGPMPPTLAYLTHFPRLSIVLDGCHPTELLRRGKVATVRLPRGQALFVPANAWNKPEWSSPVEVMTFLFGARQIGISLVYHDGKTEDPASALKTTLHGAYDPLTREIARRYLLAGAPLTHDELVITVGCCEAINLSLRAVTRPGDTVAIETPAYFGFLETIQSLGLRTLEVPTEPRTGIDLAALRDALTHNDVKAEIVMPSFQNPLGSCMPDDKKERLYRLLADFDVPAIEDDIYGDLHFGERRPKPLKAWDTDGRVLLCSSFGKTLAPSLRVGWCAPGRYLERVRRLKFTNTLGTPVVLQKTVSDFLRPGGYDHHLRSIRRAYQNQLHLFSQAILRHFPEGTRLSRPQGGFILWAELPAGVDTLQLHRDALRHHINTAPGALFSVKDRYRNCLRMNCGIPWSEPVDAALHTLGGLARAQLA